MTRNESMKETLKQAIHNRARVIALLAFVLAAVLSMVGCSSPLASSSSEGKLSVVVSVNQWSSVVKAIAGDNADVQTILSSPSVDAHDFEPQAQDVSRISSAQLVVLNGAGYDTWAKNAAQTGNAKLVSAAQENGTQDGDNPHLWFSAQARRALASGVYKQLVKLDGKHKADYSSRYNAWLKKEKKVEEEITAIRDNLEKTSTTSEGLTYAATESVADYLAHDLGLTDRTPRGYAQAVQNESEPAPSDLHAFETLLTSKKADVLVVNKQELDSTAKQVLAAAKKAGVPTVELTETRPEKYATTLEWMSALVSDFQKALSSTAK